MLKIISLLSLLSFSFVPTTRLLDATSSNLTIEGTSTLHEWEMNSTDFFTSGELLIDGQNIQTKNFKLNFPVKKLASGKSTMDDYCHKALKEDENPKTTFEVKQVVKTGEVTTAQGNLTIAGVTKLVSIKLNLKPTDANVIVSGSTSLKMSDYGVTPPTVLFGTITCGDEVTIKFQMAFKS